MERMFQEANRLVCRWDGETLIVEPWGENGLRVRSAMLREPEDTDYALLPQERAEAVITVGEERSEIRNGKIIGVMEKGKNSGAVLSFYNSEGKLLLAEAGEGGALNRRSRFFKPVIGGDYQLAVTFASDPEEKLYGMGQYQQDFLNIKYCNLELAQRNSQASVPFLLSSLGYGFLWHNQAVGRANFGANTTEWFAQSTKQLDYWITAGDTPDEIECAYSAVTGRVPMMPEYGLGFWQCKLRYWNQEQILSVAETYHQKGIKLDVIGCDFFHWPRMGDFRFDEEFFPDPEGMVKRLEELGVQLMVSVWPEVAWTSENYEEMKQKGLLVKAEKGIDLAKLFNENSTFTDVTNPQARDYLWEKCRKNYLEKGIRLFWLDEAEPGFTTYDYDNYRCRMGTQAQVGNLYPQLFTRTFYEGLRREGVEKPVNLVRCAWAGSQRYGALVWSGDIHSDWKTFRRQVCAGLNMGIAGIPWWTTDIGGFHGAYGGDPSFRKLFIRWFQYACFCPVMRLHGNREPQRGFEGDMVSGIGLFGSGADNEVYSFGDEVFAICKKYMFLREELRPYIKEQMRLAHEKGTPVMRPLFYDFPADKKAWETDDAYMFGPDFCVAPVMEEDVYERRVYLPEGPIWKDVFSGICYEGGRTVTVDAPMEKIPVFIRADSKWGDFAL